MQSMHINNQIHEIKDSAVNVNTFYYILSYRLIELKTRLFVKQYV